MSDKSVALYEVILKMFMKEHYLGNYYYEEISVLVRKGCPPVCDSCKAKTLLEVAQFKPFIPLSLYILLIMNIVRNQLIEVIKVFPNSCEVKKIEVK